MSAETLRRAAALMRERAGASAASPWETYTAVGGRSGVLELHGVRSVPINETGEFDPEVSQSIDSGDAAHIASWHPAVALAVADWMDGVVDAMTNPDAPNSGVTTSREEHRALAVARAYLGEPS